MKPLAMTGACVICIDHLAKNTESRAQGATGTAAKRRAIGGTSIRVRVTEAFVPGRVGAAHLLVHDRYGGLRQHCPTGEREPVAGTFTLGADLTGGTSWSVTAPATTDRNPARLPAVADVEAVAALDPAPTSVADVAVRMQWRKQRAADALREWRKQGPTAAVPGSLAVPGPEEPLLISQLGLLQVDDVATSCAPATAEPFASLTTHLRHGQDA